MTVASEVSLSDKRSEVKVATDSSAANGIVHRRGAGKVKHLEVRQLWVQDHVEKGEIICSKIPRDRNLADLFTHHWSPGESLKFDEGLGLDRQSS